MAATKFQLLQVLFCFYALGRFHQLLCPYKGTTSQDVLYWVGFYRHGLVFNDILVRSFIWLSHPASVTRNMAPIIIFIFLFK